MDAGGPSGSLCDDPPAGSGKFLSGELVEVGDTERLFEGEVADERTRGYLEGRFG